jgi:hypothetical protein
MADKGAGRKPYQQLLERDNQIVRWFIEEAEGRCIKASPLGDLFAPYEVVDGP